MILVIDTESFDPYFNLATEEYFFRNFNEDILFLYINSPSVIIGKHQNAYEELNLEYVSRERLPVVRRISGGGTVYHDKGNLNFTLIKNREEGKQIGFAEFSEPIISYFKEHGLAPYMGDKNELREDGWKFSGNAEHVFKLRALHHGTLLYHSILEKLGDALRPGTGIYKSRAVKSNRTNVGNLAPKLKHISSIYELKDKLTSYLCKDIDFKNYIITDTDREEILKLTKEKYSTDEWNYTYGPDYSFSNDFEFEGKNISLDLSVKKGLISSISLNGDSELSKLSSSLKGTPHNLLNIELIISENNPSIPKEVIFKFFD